MTKEMVVASRFSLVIGDVSDTVKARFKYTSLSRFGWFTEVESNGYVGPDGTAGPYWGASDYKMTGDSIFGYAHTNGWFHLAGRPYFERTISASKEPELMPYKGEMDPIKMGGDNWSRTVPRDTANMLALRSAMNTASALPSAWFQNQDVGLEFISNGTVRVRVPWNSGSTGDTIVAWSQLSSTGVVGVSGGDLHIKGTYKGLATVVAFSGSGSPAHKGNVWIDGNILAATNPRVDSTSPDMLGIIAERSGYISVDSTRTEASVLEIQAAIYCHNGELTAERYWELGPAGRISLFGSLCQRTAGSMGVFDPSPSQEKITAGFSYSIRHDWRLLDNWPPSFPVSAKYRLLSWWEK
jgi:hypothetical protein